MKKFIIGFWTVFMAVLLITGCENSLGMVPESDNGKVRLHLGLENPDASRTVLPTAVEEGWTYELSGALSGSDQAVLGSWSELSQAELLLDQGTWDFTMRILDNSTERYVSTLSNVVLGSEPQTLVFSLTPPATGQGSMEISMEVPSAVHRFEMVNMLFPEPTISIVPQNGNISLQRDMDAGSYNYHVTLLNVDEEILASFTEVFMVEHQLVTRWDLVITEEQLNSAPAAPTDFSYTVVDDTPGNYTVEFSWKDNANNEVEYRLETPNMVLETCEMDSTSAQVVFDLGGDYEVSLAAKNYLGESQAQNSLQISVANGVSFDMNGALDSQGSGIKPSDDVVYGEDYSVSGMGDFQKIQDGIDLRFVEWLDPQGNSYQPGDTIPAQDLADVQGCLELQAQWSVIGGIGPAGGLVFFDDQLSGPDIPGARYLELAPSSAEVSRQWEGFMVSFDRAKGGSPGSGYLNTQEIVRAFSAAGKINYAAEYAWNLDCNGYSDWFLPTVPTMFSLFGNLHTQGLGDLQNQRYWSSLNDSGTRAYAVDFSNNSQVATGRNSNLLVRPVRAFSSEEPSVHIIYESNGAEGYTYDAAFYTSGDSVTLADGSNYTNPWSSFAGWNTQADGNGQSYAAGEIIVIEDVSVVLYAQWNDFYAVGDIGPADGRIFYVNPNAAADGWKYMEAANGFLMNTVWIDNASYHSQSVGTSPDIGAGLANTQAIAALTTSDSIAKKCVEHSATVGGVVYDDWFLPSSGEMQLIRTNLHDTGIKAYLTNISYASSTESSVDRFHYFNFNLGYVPTQLKNLNGYSIPARRF